MSVKGTVKDQQGIPLPYANVYYINTTTGLPIGIGTTTDENGNYSIIQKAGYTLVASSIGYSKVSNIVMPILFFPNTINFVLEQGADLPGVEVIAQNPNQETWFEKNKAYVVGGTLLTAGVIFIINIVRNGSKKNERKA